MKTTKAKKRFRHSFDMWLRDGVWGIGNARLDSPLHENRPHIEASIGGGLSVRATAYADESAQVGEHDIRTLAALACGDVRRCGIYLAVYCMSDFVSLVGPHERGVIAIPSEMDAAAEELLEYCGDRRILSAVRGEVELRELRLASLKNALAEVDAGGSNS